MFLVPIIQSTICRLLCQRQYADMFINGKWMTEVLYKYSRSPSQSLQYVDYCVSEKCRYVYKQNINERSSI